MYKNKPLDIFYVLKRKKTKGRGSQRGSDENEKSSCHRINGECFQEGEFGHWIEGEAERKLLAWALSRNMRHKFPPLPCVSFFGDPQFPCATVILVNPCGYK